MRHCGVRSRSGAERTLGAGMAEEDAREVAATAEIEQQGAEYARASALCWLAAALAASRASVRENWLAGTTERPFHHGRRDRAAHGGTGARSSPPASFRGPTRGTPRAPPRASTGRSRGRIPPLVARFLPSPRLRARLLRPCPPPGYAPHHSDFAPHSVAFSDVS